MDFKIVAELIIILVIALILSTLVKPWEVPDRKIDKLKRSLIIGVMAALVGPIMIFVAGWNFKTIQLSLDTVRLFAVLFFCLGVPFGIVATLGFYISYSQLEWMLNKKKNIAGKKDSKN